MFGFGKKSLYRDAVWQLLNTIDAVQYLPTMAPLNGEIEKYRNHKFSEHEAALLLCYSSALSIAAADNLSRAQRLYDIARNAQDTWISDGYVNAEEASGYNSHISQNSDIIARL